MPWCQCVITYKLLYLIATIADIFYDHHYQLKNIPKLKLIIRLMTSIRGIRFIFIPEMRYKVFRV